jgi:nucleotide sugar dehydrogenase
MNVAALLKISSPWGEERAAAEVRAASAAPTVAVIGMGYVGLPTALALSAAGFGVVGIDVSDGRLRDIRERSVDLVAKHQGRLTAALASQRFALSADPASMRAADAVLICVPTPIDHDRRPDLRHLASACADVVRHARPGQTIVLTSTTHVGSTREHLIEPLQARGLRVGEDVFVVFSPERIDPGNVRHDQEDVPRVIGPATPECARRAHALFTLIASRVHQVSSPEAAELTKLHENTFRAVNIALANELARATLAYGLDPAEVLDAAATKPYGFMPFHPGPGVGGHCIPCDPHYLLEPLDAKGVAAPLVRCAMDAIAARPREVADRAIDVLREGGTAGRAARVLLVGMSYKPGVSDVRESPGIEVLRLLHERGLSVAYHDPLVPTLCVAGLSLIGVARPRPEDYDLTVVLTVQPRADLSWLQECEHVLDSTYRGTEGRRRHVL